MGPWAARQRAGGISYRSICALCSSSFGAPLLARIVRISKRHNITSIADFVGARYGRHKPMILVIMPACGVGAILKVNVIKAQFTQT
jgi:Na+/proline symporter